MLFITLFILHSRGLMKWQTKKIERERERKRVRDKGRKRTRSGCWGREEN